MDIFIDERIKSHLPKLSEESFSQLEANILRDGCIDPLVIWVDSDSRNVLVDGHNRYAICKKHGLPFKYTHIEFDDVDDVIAWIEDFQAGRRNAPPDWFAYYLGQKYEREKKAQNDGGAGTPKGTGDQNDHRLKTAEKIAADHGVSAPTVRRSADFARDVEAIASKVGDAARSEILDGGLKATRADVHEVAEAIQDEALTFSSAKEAFDWVKQQRQERAAALRAELSVLKHSAPKLPDGQYSVIVIDPPWQMEKIERDVAPNQVAFEYPTMSEDDLHAFDVQSISAPDCHLFCWTTHKHLPMALRLLEAWGFRYTLTMVWHKPGGFQPFGLPQYNCEFIVYARKGKPAFADTKQFFACFEAPRREHSRKPDQFYDVIRRVTDGPRIDVFSREKRDGFDQFGNESDKFDGEAA